MILEEIFMMESDSKSWDGEGHRMIEMLFSRRSKELEQEMISYNKLIFLILLTENARLIAHSAQ